MDLISELLEARVPIHIMATEKEQLSKSSGFIFRALTEGREIFVLIPSSLNALILDHITPI